MLALRTAQGFTLPINWIGISDFDGSLRFETPETDLAMLFSVFSDPEHTEDEERGYHPRIQPAGKSARRLSLLQSI